MIELHLSILFLRELLLVMGYFSVICPESGPDFGPVRGPESDPVGASKVRSGSGPAGPEKIGSGSSLVTIHLNICQMNQMDKH